MLLDCFNLIYSLCVEAKEIIIHIRIPPQPQGSELAEDQSLHTRDNRSVNELLVLYWLQSFY